MTQVHQHHIGSLTRCWFMWVSAWDSASLKNAGCQGTRGRNHLHLVCPLGQVLFTYLRVCEAEIFFCLRAKQILTRGTNGICSSGICLCLTSGGNQRGKGRQRPSCWELSLSKSGFYWGKQKFPGVRGQKLTAWFTAGSDFCLVSERGRGGLNVKLDAIYMGF